MTKLSTLLDQIDNGTLLLPEFQRGYVWNRDQVRGLMRSLYLGYPVGSLIVWETTPEEAALRGAGNIGGGPKRLLLDGQQRITTLYGVTRGHAPRFFDGDENAFGNLWFHVGQEAFEFYAPTKMQDDPSWIDVTRLFTHGLEPVVGRFATAPEMAGRLSTYITRVSRIHALLERQFHEEQITGADKTVNVVVDIFNRVNSGGTKLSKGDLALAKICAHWPEARSTMRQYLDTWHSAGYDQFTLDWLLRSANAVATGRAPFNALEHVDSETFRTSLTASAGYLDTFLNAAAGRLGLDHGRVLMGRYAAPVVARFLHVSGGAFANAAERDRMLFWYVHSALWGRFAGSTETVLAQDYEILHQSGIDGLINALERWRGGNLVISGHDFDGFGRGSRFYPLLYLLTRVGSARDFGSGLELHKSLLGKSSGLQVHHIFPKSLLYAAGYSRGEVNGIANYCFLTQDTNLKISNRHPAEYFVEVEAANPGALASQWIPDDPELWELERYPDFLAARRKLLAQAANAFLDELRSGSAAAAPVVPRPSVAITDDGNDAEDLAAMATRLADLGCALPETDVEIADPRSGEPVTVADAVWPDGLQAGQGSPVVLMLSPGAAVLAALQRLGYEVFTSAEALLDVAELRNVAASGATDQGVMV